MARKRTAPRSPPAPSSEELDAVAEILDRLASNPRLIPNIYNYCDRWCERCAFTSRCLSFQLNRATEARLQDAGGNSSTRRTKAFWADIARSFEFALRLIEREAARLGIDLEAPGALDEAEREERTRRRLATCQGSALHQAARGYRKAGHDLLERMQPDLTDTVRELTAQARLGAGHPGETAADIGDALAVVQWYLFFIDLKIQRAIAERIDHRRDGMTDDQPRAADGLAKAALVAIDRSIGAWVRLHGHFVREADATLDILVRLERLRRSVEREFPAARAFRRPGFD